MTVQRLLFDVEYDDPSKGEVEFRVRVTMADRIEAETNGRKFGVVDPVAQAQLLGSVWLYLASLRAGAVDPSTTFEEFKVRCLDNSRVEVETVPPTSEESSATSSDSVATSPGSTGSETT